MKLRVGDQVIAHIGGRTGPAVVVADQVGETVTIQWTQARPGAPPIVALRDRLVYVPGPEHVGTPLDELIERVLQRYDP